MTNKPERMVYLLCTRGEEVLLVAVHCQGMDREEFLAKNIRDREAEGYTVKIESETPLHTEVTAREAIYDAEIAPLMTKIIEVCKSADIPLVAAFQLDDRTDGQCFNCVTKLTPPGTHDALLAMVNAYRRTMR